MELTLKEQMGEESNHLCASVSWSAIAAPRHLVSFSHLLESSGDQLHCYTTDSIKLLTPVGFSACPFPPGFPDFFPLLVLANLGGGSVARSSCSFLFPEFRVVGPLTINPSSSTLFIPSLFRSFFPLTFSWKYKMTLVLCGLSFFLKTHRDRS